MEQEEFRYIAIDLKSFYASVECVDRGLDPLTTNLVVADAQRTEKTICLAVSPSLKAHGISGRARLFEVIEQVKLVNDRRRWDAPGERLAGSSSDAPTLQNHPSLALDYIVAPPRMARYMEVSTQIYQIYLRYVAPEDIHVYSIDEVFMDVSAYLQTYKMTAKELAMTMIRDVLRETGITATAGIGTNMYLCKIAMDIVAKKMPADENGVRIAQLDELAYRRQLWEHRPLTDFWRIGKGYARKLEAKGLYTMGDIARCSLTHEELLYRMFGVNAELLIDHAWGWECCTIADVKAYRPENRSISSGQVLKCPYEFEKGRLIVREMTELLVLDLVEQGLATDQIVLTVGYDIGNLADTERASMYRGEVTSDHYGRKVPKSAHGSVNLGKHTSSTKNIIEKVLGLYDRIVDRDLTVRRLCLAANHIISEQEVKEDAVQLELFTDYDALVRKQEAEAAMLDREKKMQRAILAIRKKYGKNAILKGMNFEEGATTIERNGQVGGHRA
ncbi:MAG: DNA methylase [Oscillospiraceae bacterium]|nr:DNA methylase [Oscillospiraceae bacterium]